MAIITLVDYLVMFGKKGAFLVSDVYKHEGFDILGDKIWLIYVLSSTNQIFIEYLLINTDKLNHKQTHTHTHTHIMLSLIHI